MSNIEDAAKQINIILDTLRPELNVMTLDAKANKIMDIMEKLEDLQMDLEDILEEE